LNKGTIHIDDISMNGWDSLDKAISQGWETIVISDVYLCFPLERQKALNYLKKYDTEWIYFANDPEKCYHNVVLRMSSGDCRKVENFIRFATKSYIIPENATIKPVWSQK
jgi:hypothetical protein